VLNLRQGIIHPCYTVALAPAIGALVGVGVTETFSMSNTGCFRGKL